MLRPEPGCPRRLALALRERNGTPTASGRYRVSNRLLTDVRLAHSTLRAPTMADFPEPADLFPEERTLYRATARAYCALFADRPAELVDLDQWETTVSNVRIVAPLGVPVRLEDGLLELRRLQTDGRLRTPSPDDLRVLGLRVGETPFRVVTADLVHVDQDTIEVSDLDVGESWLHERVLGVESRANEDVVRPGVECTWCAFTLDCKGLRE